MSCSSEFGIAHLRKTPARWRFRAANAAALEIARALAADPAFMLLDEPLPASIRSRSPNQGAGAPAHRRGIGVLITDHSVRETLALVDRAYIIHGGKVMIQGTPRNHRRGPRRPPRLSRRAVYTSEQVHSRRTLSVSLKQQ